MFKSVEKCLPFYKILKKDKSFKWSEDCENAFTQLKEYMSFLPILTRLEDGETLFLYIVMYIEIVRLVVMGR